VDGYPSINAYRILTSQAVKNCLPPIFSNFISASPSRSLFASILSAGGKVGGWCWIEVPFQVPINMVCFFNSEVLVPVIANTSFSVVDDTEDHHDQPISPHVANTPQTIYIHHSLVVLIFLNISLSLSLKKPHGPIDAPGSSYKRSTLACAPRTPWPRLPP
jgi:hypothetical protein